MQSVAETFPDSSAFRKEDVENGKRPLKRYKSNIRLLFLQ